MTTPNKYQREIKPGVFVDVYDVLKAFIVVNPALQHLVKKALAVGQRGHKDAAEDLQDIIDSAIRAKELELAREPAAVGETEKGYTIPGFVIGRRSHKNKYQMDCAGLCKHDWVAFKPESEYTVYVCSNCYASEKRPKK